jgi:hypothetical protein
MHTHQKSSDPVATIGLDIGKNTFRSLGSTARRHRDAHQGIAQSTCPPACQSALGCIVTVRDLDDLNRCDAIEMNNAPQI